MLQRIRRTRGEFWADRHQITLDLAIDRSRGFNRDVDCRRSNFSAQFDGLFGQQGFTAGQHDMLDAGFDGRVNDRIDRH